MGRLAVALDIGIQGELNVIECLGLVICLDITEAPQNCRRSLRVQVLLELEEILVELGGRKARGSGRLVLVQEKGERRPAPFGYQVRDEQRLAGRPGTDNQAQLRSPEPDAGAFE